MFHWTYWGEWSWLEPYIFLKCSAVYDCKIENNIWQILQQYSIHSELIYVWLPAYFWSLRYTLEIWNKGTSARLSQLASVVIRADMFCKTVSGAVKRLDIFNSKSKNYRLKGACLSLSLQIKLVLIFKLCEKPPF